MTSDAEIRVSVSPGEVRVAGLQHGRLEAAFIERVAQPDGVGDLHLARVTAILPAMSGAFLIFGNDQTGFLPESELPPPRRAIGKALHEGQILAVRISRAAQGGKGPRLTARLTAEDLALADAGTNRLPRLLRRGPNAAVRLARLWPDATITTDGPEWAARLRAALGAGRVNLRLAGAFDAELEAAFDSLADARVALEGGASLLIHPTPALTAMDVDSGSLAGSRDTAAHAALNQAATAAVARQIRLRNLAGAILVDFAGLPIRKREALVAPLESALASDPLGAKLLGMTRLGLMEIVRPRIHPPLHEILGLPPSPLTLGLAAIRQALREVTALQGAAFALVAAPEIIQAIEASPEAAEAYRNQAGRPLVLRADACLRPGQEQIIRVEA
ncbi:ribonuclease E/G [Falsiroseomonas sp.]|uniref:ribonuclease E/G n=1 Tax=Falsiroseomonas sp. TaxID=2870721 RepID=UPI00272552B6|nr:ribonuclease E/G [Falsiroseomonas sp.]MDO9499523.1 ribonuclease E/G [Falsiroseomonas sp.]